VILLANCTFSQNFKTVSKNLKTLQFLKKIFKKKRNCGEILLEILQFLFFRFGSRRRIIFHASETNFKREALHFHLPNDAKISIFFKTIFKTIFKKYYVFEKLYVF
jgi:hypothetical protein